MPSSPAARRIPCGAGLGRDTRSPPISTSAGRPADFSSILAARELAPVNTASARPWARRAAKTAGISSEPTGRTRRVRSCCNTTSPTTGTAVARAAAPPFVLCMSTPRGGTAFGRYRRMPYPQLSADGHGQGTHPRGPAGSWGRRGAGAGGGPWHSGGRAPAPPGSAPTASRARVPCGPLRSGWRCPSSGSPRRGSCAPSSRRDAPAPRWRGSMPRRSPLPAPPVRGG